MAETAAVTINQEEVDLPITNSSALENDRKGEFAMNMNDCKLNLLQPAPILQVEDPSQANEQPPNSDYANIVQKRRNAFISGKTRPIQWRIKQLKAFIRMLDENTETISAAIAADLGRNIHETITLELLPMKYEALLMIDNIAEWSAPETRPKKIIYILDSVKLYKDPYGVVLVMGAWNYPFQLSLLPMVGAIAAGNCVILKPSEVCQQCAKLMAKLIPKYLDNECYKVILGGIPETTELLKERFDFIFYTGSVTVGKIVRDAANKYLTPVALELGGKSPAYIDSTADLVTSLKRLLWGKFINAGQTCVAPDFVLCTPELRDSIVNEAKKILKDWYGDNPKNSPDLSRIVSDRQFQRLAAYLSGNGTIAVGGDSDPSQKYIAPTILVNVEPTDPVMRDEVFGPILPILTVANVHEAIKFINSREKPLALYIFSNSKKTVSLILENTSSGTVCVNDTILQLSVTSLPFGGVGNSGMGAYHGKYSFDTFVHEKSVFTRSFNALFELCGSCRYPPYSEGKLLLSNLLTARRPDMPIKYLPHTLMFVLGSLATIGYHSFFE